ncbi:hypothetical protein [Streptomyces sp. NPDC008150]|uniref:hypothetical protein n=1 Tax=Streptomyces sp. NPDC008150 TaxID=3364816 RepID=UPI0036ED18B7
MTRAEVPEGRVLSSDDGESRQVYEIAGQPDWLAKLYRTPVPRRASRGLEALIRLPDAMSAADRALLDAATAWPVARIIDGDHVQGIVMAKAPDRFSARLRNIKGEFQAPAPLPLDWLVASDDKCGKRGILPADREVRERAVRSLLLVGDLFARHDVVYGDWSYSNVFWEQGTGAIFVIDVDTCGIGSRPWIQSNGWEDPLFDETRKPPLTSLSDRYKLAVLTVRCLTGERGDPMEAHRSLERRNGLTALSAALAISLNAPSAQERCTPGELLAAFDGHASSGRADTTGRSAQGTAADPSNVTGSIPVGPSSRTTTGTAPGARTASGTPSNVTGSVDLRARSRTGDPWTRTPSTQPDPTTRSAPTGGPRTVNPSTAAEARPSASSCSTPFAGTPRPSSAATPPPAAGFGPPPSMARPDPSPAPPGPGAQPGWPPPESRRPGALLTFISTFLVGSIVILLVILGATLLFN